MPECVFELYFSIRVLWHILYWIISRGCRLYCGAEHAAAQRGKHGEMAAFSRQQRDQPPSNVKSFSLGLHFTCRKTLSHLSVEGLSRKHCNGWLIRGTLYFSRILTSSHVTDIYVCVSRPVRDKPGLSVKWCFESWWSSHCAAVKGFW